MGMASGASMTLFGLSPLLYSLVATHLFSEPDTGLEVIPFLRFMAVWTAVIHLVGAMTLIVPSLEPTPVATPAEVEAEEGTSSGSVTPLVDERQPLLPNKSLSLRDEDIDYGPAPEEDKTALQLLRDPDFWMLFVTVLLTLGAVGTVSPRFFCRASLLNQPSYYPVRNGSVQHRIDCPLPSVGRRHPSRLTRSNRRHHLHPSQGHLRLEHPDSASRRTRFRLHFSRPVRTRQWSQRFPQKTLHQPNIIPERVYTAVSGDGA